MVGVEEVAGKLIRNEVREEAGEPGNVDCESLLYWLNTPL